MLSKKYDEIIISENIICPYCYKRVHFVDNIIKCPMCNKRFYCKQVQTYVTAASDDDTQATAKMIDSILKNVRNYPY